MGKKLSAQQRLAKRIAQRRNNLGNLAYSFAQVRFDKNDRVDQEKETVLVAFAFGGGVVSAVRDTVVEAGSLDIAKLEGDRDAFASECEALSEIGNQVVEILESLAKVVGEGPYEIGDPEIQALDDLEKLADEAKQALSKLRNSLQSSDRAGGKPTASAKPPTKDDGRQHRCGLFENPTPPFRSP